MALSGVLKSLYFHSLLRVSGASLGTLGVTDDAVVWNKKKEKKRKRKKIISFHRVLSEISVACTIIIKALLSHHDAAFP